MARKSIPSPEELRQLLLYDPETGKLFWRRRPIEMFPKERFWLAWNTRYSGNEALCHDNGEGYMSGSIFDKKTFAHRAAWCLHYGYWPGQVDHINLDRADNRIVNLRESTPSENMCNVAIRKNNKSGIKGVCWNSNAGKWMAQIAFMKKSYHLGLFVRKEDAAAAYAAASERLHGEFGRTS